MAYTPKRNTEHDFWARIDYLSSECWLWLGKPRGDGYGQFTMARRCQKAHRWAWEFTHGPIPEKMCVLHKNECHNPLCVNPEHLYLGTQSENVLDQVALGTHVSQQQETRAKFSEAAKRQWANPEIRARMIASRKKAVA